MRVTLSVCSSQPPTRRDDCAVRPVSARAGHDGRIRIPSTSPRSPRVADPLPGDRQQFVEHLLWIETRLRQTDRRAEPVGRVGVAHLADLADLELRAVVGLAVNGADLVEHAGVHLSRHSAAQGELSQIGKPPRGRRRGSRRGNTASLPASSTAPWTVISRNRSASCPGNISDRVRMGMVGGMAVVGSRWE